MEHIGERIDDRDRGGSGEFYDGPMSKGPHGNSIVVAREDTPKVIERLTPAHHDTGILKVAGMTTELVHTDLEGGPRTQGGFTEEEHERLAHEQGCGLAALLALFQIQRQGQYLPDFIRRHIGKR
jgi:hypothetical protein